MLPVFIAEGVAHTVSRAGSLFSIAFREDPVRDYADAKMQEAWRYPPFFHALPAAARAAAAATPL